MIAYANTDYESVLFDKKSSLKMIRELEFLALWLNDSVFVENSYQAEYIDYIKSKTMSDLNLCNIRRGLTNWWGELKDIDNERYLNSKETSYQISQLINEPIGKIVNSWDELEELDDKQTYLFKSFSGVSGRGNKFRDKLTEGDFPILAEPLHDRFFDFSSYCLNTNEIIFYQNFISKQFGYKGSFFDLKESKTLNNLSWVKARPQFDWNDYYNKVLGIRDIVRKHGKSGFSIDSYLHNSSIRTLCEINYRRTMGITAYEIAQRISQKRYQLFLIINKKLDYKILKSKCDELEITLLSHEKSFFNYLLISSEEIVDLIFRVECLNNDLETNVELEF